MPHETPEFLSALIDGELDPLEAGRVNAHLASCAECRAASDKLKFASTAFKRSGKRPVPAGLAARAKAAAAPRRGAWLVRLAAAGAVAVFLLLVSGMAVKRFLPTLVSNIQQMITGAAGQMGSGGR